jgi:hypothetical protein
MPRRNDGRHHRHYAGQMGPCIPPFGVRRATDETSLIDRFNKDIHGPPRLSSGFDPRFICGQTLCVLRGGLPLIVCRPHRFPASPRGVCSSIREFNNSCICPGAGHAGSTAIFCESCLRNFRAFAFVIKPSRRGQRRSASMSGSRIAYPQMLSQKFCQTISPRPDPCQNGCVSRRLASPPSRPEDCHTLADNFHSRLGIGSPPRLGRHTGRLNQIHRRRNRTTLSVLPEA